MNKEWYLPKWEEYRHWRLPLVEVFETVEGEGIGAGWPTVFVRLFHCNLRCSWCDTPYSYAPAQSEFEATIEEVASMVNQYPSRRICLTGGEPLIHKEKSAALLVTLAKQEQVEDVHIETNGAIDLAPFDKLRQQVEWGSKMRFIMDYKLPASGEEKKMIPRNFDFLTERDEVKFVIGDEEDFRRAVDIISKFYQQGTVLFSPVFEQLSPAMLVHWILQEPLPQAKLSLQLHKYIWDPTKRGV